MATGVDSCPLDETDSIEQIAAHIWSNISIHSLPSDTVHQLLQQDFMKAGLIHRALESRDAKLFQYILDCGLELRSEDGVSLIAEAARRNNFSVASLLLSYGIDINGFLTFENVHVPVLLLSATRISVSNSLGLLQGCTAASLEMIDFLIREGAKVDTCTGLLDLFSMNEQRSRIIDVLQLKHLLDNGLDVGSGSIFTIMVQV
jgi:hypothetical protein